MTKLTQRDFFTNAINVFNGEVSAIPADTMVEFFKSRLELLDKKSANKKPTKTQEENEGLKVEILNVLTNEGATVTEVQSKSIVLGDLSNQRVSALLRQLIADGKVVKTVDKKKSYFSLA